MDEQKTSAVITRQDETKTSPVTVFDMGSLLRTLQALAEEKPEQYKEIDLSWIEDAVNQKLIENKFSPYETVSEDIEINVPFTSSAYGNNVTVGITPRTYYYSLNEEEFKPVLTTNIPLVTSFVDIAYGNGVFILVSSTGGVVQRIKETDIVAEYNAGEQLLNAPQAAYSAIAANGSSFVAVSSTGEIFRTDDNGDTWQLAVLYSGVQFTSVTAGTDGVFAAISNTGENRFYISYDYGLTWKAYPMPELNQWSDIAYSKEHNAFVACSIDGNNRLAFYDVATNTWKAVKSPTQRVWRSISAGNGIFTAVSSDGYAISSYDGKEWYSIDIPNAEWVSLVRTDNFFVVFSSNGKIARSSNGGLTGLLFANENEVLTGTEPTKAISPVTLWQAINSLLPLAIDKGGTGATTAQSARDNLGLSNVDNTSDLNKPISTAVQTALNSKADTSTVTTVQTALNSKANTSDLAGYLPLTGGTITGTLAVSSNITGATLIGKRAGNTSVSLVTADDNASTGYLYYYYNSGTPILRLLNYAGGNSNKGQIDISNNSLHISSMGKGTGINVAPDSNYTLKVGGKTYIGGALETTGNIESTGGTIYSKAMKIKHPQTNDGGGTLNFDLYTGTATTGYFTLNTWQDEIRFYASRKSDNAIVGYFGANAATDSFHTKCKYNALGGNPDSTHTLKVHGNTNITGTLKLGNGTLYTDASGNLHYRNDITGVSIQLTAPQGSDTPEPVTPITNSFGGDSTIDETITVPDGYTLFEINVTSNIGGDLTVYLNNTQIYNISEQNPTISTTIPVSAGSLRITFNDFAQSNIQITTTLS